MVLHVTEVDLKMKAYEHEMRKIVIEKQVELKRICRATRILLCIESFNQSSDKTAIYIKKAG